MECKRLKLGRVFFLAILTLFIALTNSSIVDQDATTTDQFQKVENNKDSNSIKFSKEVICYDEMFIQNIIKVIDSLCQFPEKYNSDGKIKILLKN